MKSNKFPLPSEVEISGQVYVIGNVLFAQGALPISKI